MRSGYWMLQLLLLLYVYAARAAINLDGSRAVQPASANSSIASPIDGLDVYWPDQHDCPPPCIDVANVHSWVPYFSVQRLQRCKMPMLVQFSVDHPLDDPTTTIFIRSCTIGPVTLQNTSGLFTVVENPKVGYNLLEPSLDTAPACVSEGKKDESSAYVSQSEAGDVEAAQVSTLLDGMKEFFDASDNCDESFLFGHYNSVVAGAYIGRGLAKKTAQTTLQSLSSRLRNLEKAPRRTTVDNCGDMHQSDQMFGIAIDTNASLATIQRMAMQWSLGKCASNGSNGVNTELAGAEIWKASVNFQTNMTISNETDGRISLNVTISNSRRNKVTGGPRTFKRQTSGSCPTHLVQNGDTCFALAQQYGATVDDIETWNKGKTWGWQGCADMLVGYIICIGPGSAPMPAPQQGAQCGPLVPGTKAPTDVSVSLADLNPCPLKACCSNWGFCGVFPAHCTVNAPEGAAPGAKNKDAQNTCVSNCGTAIKRNSGPPAAFGRVGYYSSFAYGRPCLHLPARDANTDGSYTVIHWAFAEIDPNGWNVVIKDPGKQWDDFKALKGVKRVISFGGWAYSTEPATYDIIRRAILTNYDAFTDKVVQFVQDQGLDGVDIDWEYPGAPDITVNGQPIGRRTDGILYQRFIRMLRSKIGNDKLLAIAAPASYWYLKAFPIDTLAASLDYIVYMTYDLHGQWDYGNPNAFDNCDSGKCIRSHVNLTETSNALGMITKAGVPNNKIYVGEASYGRTFHAAESGCYGEMCDFTGSRTNPDATPGRCTNTGGYLAMAEIMELQSLRAVTKYHDSRSNSDIMLYNGDYVSYMTDTTKNTRRARWSRLSFGGSIDWALDLQSFTSSDGKPPTNLPKPGEEGCVSGDDATAYTGELCGFTCSLGFCPEEYCECLTTGPVKERPSSGSVTEAEAVASSHVILNQLCSFACGYGFCPQEYCVLSITEGGQDEPKPSGELWARGKEHECISFKDRHYREASLFHCMNYCAAEVAQAIEEGRTTNYGCMAIVDGKGLIPWSTAAGSGERGIEAAPGRCLCDNFVINSITDAFVEALPIIAQLSCAILMNSLKMVLEIGLSLFPPGRVIAAGLDMLLTATEVVNHVYQSDQDPASAYSFWLAPCGGDGLLPDEAKQAFDIMSLVPGGVSSYKNLDNIPRGSGRKGDNGNPTDQGTPRAAPRGGGKNKKNAECKKSGEVKDPERNLGGPGFIVRQSSCGSNGRWTATDYVATSALYPVGGKTETSTSVCGLGRPRAAQACRHYSSAISVRPQYGTKVCPPTQATVAPPRKSKSSAVRRWYSQHPIEFLWQNQQYRVHQGACQVDEYPPYYLLGDNLVNQPNAQLVRFLPGISNSDGGRTWKSFCLFTPFLALSEAEFIRRVKQAAAGASPDINTKRRDAEYHTVRAEINVDFTPAFALSFDHPVLPNDGLDDNECYPSGIAPNDPGFALLDDDPYNLRNPRPGYNYKAEYAPPTNGHN